MTNEQVTPEVEQVDRDIAACFYAARAFGNSKEEELKRILRLEMEGELDMLVYLFSQHRLTALADRDAAVAAAYEDAARICEQQAQDFLSPEYAWPQPIGSLTERFACTQCATAIRARSGGR